MSNLVAVSDPTEFKFDDELTEAGDQNMNREIDDESFAEDGTNSNAMRLVQSKQ